MKSLRTNYAGRHHMLRTDFELLHYRDAIHKEIKGHKHKQYELVFINSGANMGYSINGSSYKVATNDIILVGSNINHHPIPNPTAVYDRIVIYINPDFVKSISKGDAMLWYCFDDPFRINRPVLHLKEDALAPIKSTLRKLEQSCNVGSYGNEMLAQLYMTETLVLLNRIYMGVEDDVLNDDVVENKLIDNVLSYISENLTSELTLDILSERFFINKYHLLREFKKHVGYTVHNYIKIQRLTRSENIMREGQHPLADICHLCGFGDYSSFFRAFKGHFGMTPNQYLRKLRTSY